LISWKRAENKEDLVTFLIVLENLSFEGVYLFEAIEGFFVLGKNPRKDSMFI
jgi:hypothetical protein